MDKEWRPKNTGDEFPTPKAKDKSKPHKELPEFEPGDEGPSQLSATNSGPSSSGMQLPAGGKQLIIWSIVGLIALALLLIFIVIPAVRGYATYSAMKESGVPDEYLTNMQGLIDAKKAAEEKIEKSNQELSAAQSQVNSCSAEKNACRETSDEFQRQVDVLSSELNDAKNLALEHEEVIADAGRRICCVARIENPSINAYAVLDGKITCTSEGGTAITC